MAEKEGSRGSRRAAKAQGLTGKRNASFEERYKIARIRKRFEHLQRRHEAKTRKLKRSSNG